MTAYCARRKKRLRAAGRDHDGVGSQSAGNVGPIGRMQGGSLLQFHRGATHPSEIEVPARDFEEQLSLRDDLRKILARQAGVIDGRHLVGRDGASPDSEVIQQGNQVATVVIGVNAGAILADVDGELTLDQARHRRRRLMVGNRERQRIYSSGQLHWMFADQYAIQIAIDIGRLAIRRVLDAYRHMVPVAIFQHLGRVGLAKLVRAQVRTGHVDAIVAAALRKDAPTRIAAAVPVFIGDERNVIALVGVIAPEGNRPVISIGELKVRRVAQRGVFVVRTVNQRGDLERVAEQAGHKRRVWIRRRTVELVSGVIATTRTIIQIAVKGKMNHQSIGKRPAKDFEDRRRAGRRAVAVHGGDLISAGLAELHGIEG